MEIVDRVFYARHDTRTPVLAAVLAVVINVVASLVLMRIDFRGLALANSIAALVEAGVLLRFVSRRMPGLTIGRLTTPALRILAASLVMGLPVAWLAAQLDPLLRPYGTPGEALLLVTCVSFGAVLYGVTSVAFRSEEISALRRLVRFSGGKWFPTNGTLAKSSGYRVRPSSGAAPAWLGAPKRTSARASGRFRSPLAPSWRAWD